MKNGTKKGLFAKYCLVALFAIFLGFAGQIAGPAVPAAEAQIVPVGVGPTYGAPYGEWSARWWQWAISLPVSVNPILSDGSVDCTLGQTGNVWFLAGNFGGVSNRTCTIPNKPLFFPVFNFVAFDPFPYETILDLRKQVETPILNPTNLRVDININGSPALSLNTGQLLNFRAQSPVFQVVIPKKASPPPKPDPGPFLIDAGLHPTMVTDGYWLLLNPLGVGSHTIRIQAADANSFSLDVTYHLTVQ